MKYVCVGFREANILLGRKSLVFSIFAYIVVGMVCDLLLLQYVSIIAVSMYCSIFEKKSVLNFLCTGFKLHDDLQRN